MALALYCQMSWSSSEEGNQNLLFSHAGDKSDGGLVVVSGVQSNALLLAPL